MPGAWLSYGRGQDETRFSTLAQITTGNAKTLGLAWSYVLGAGTAQHVVGDRGRHVGTGG